MAGECALKAAYTGRTTGCSKQIVMYNGFGCVPFQHCGSAAARQGWGGLRKQCRSSIVHGEL